MDQICPKRVFPLRNRKSEYYHWILQCCHRTIKTLGLLGLVTLHRIFFVQCCLEPLGQHCIGFWPVQSCPKSIKTTLTRIFSVHCCLEPSGQYRIDFLPVQCCPSGIKTRLHKFFSGAMLLGASRTTLRRFFLSVVQYCPNSISWNKIVQDYTFFVIKPFFCMSLDVLNIMLEIKFGFF